MKERDVHPLRSWSMAAAVGALALAVWCWLPNAIATPKQDKQNDTAADDARAKYIKSLLSKRPVPSKKVVVPSKKPAKRAIRPVASRPVATRPVAARPVRRAAPQARPAKRSASTTSKVLAAAVLPNFEATLQAVVTTSELIAAKELKKFSQKLVRDVVSKLFPHLKKLKLHRALTMLPAMIRPFGVDLSKPVGVLAFVRSRRRFGRMRPVFVPVVMVTIERTRFMAALHLLGLSPRLHTQDGATLLSLGKAGRGSALGTIVGNRFYFTMRTPNRRVGLHTEAGIRSLLSKLGKQADPFAQAFIDAGRAGMWRDALAGKRDMIAVVPKFSRLSAYVPRNPVLRFLQSVGFGFSIRDGYTTNFFVRVSPRLKPVFTPFLPTPNAKNFFNYLPPRLLVAGESHINLKALLALPQKLVAARVIPPMVGMMATGRVNMTKNMLKSQGFDIDQLLAMLTGQFSSGIILDQKLRGNIAQGAGRAFRGTMHGAFALFGLRSAANGPKLLQVLETTYQQLAKAKPMIGKRLSVTRVTIQGLAALKIQVSGAQPDYLLVKGDVLGFAGSTATCEQLAAVWTGAATSLAQHLKRNPGEAAAFGKTKGNFGSISVAGLRTVMADAKRLPARLAPLKVLVQRLKWIKFNTLFQTQGLDTNFSVGVASRPKLPLPAPFKGTSSATKGPNMMVGVLGVALAGLPLSGLPIVGLAGVAVPAFLKYTRKSKTTEAHLNIKAISDGAISYFYAEHSDSNGDPLTKEFPHHKPGTTNAGRSVSINPPGKPCANGKSMYPKNPKIWNKAPWKQLRFSINRKHYFQYTFISEGTANVSKFTVIARADMDCDGKLSTYKQTATVNPKTGEVERSSLIITDALE